MTIPPGIYAAALTPLNDDLSCDSKLLSSHCFELIERGCQGIALFGTTGEGSSFSTGEKKAELEKLIGRGFDPKRIILANGSANIYDTVDLAKAAVDLGCAAVLICPPSFYKNVQDEGVIAYYREVIRRTAHSELKVILYHIPQYSGVPISLRTIESLRKEFPDIVIGIKESEGNLDFTKAILERFPGFEVFVGKESQIIESVRSGGSGAICGIANLYPELMCSLYNTARDSKIGLCCVGQPLNLRPACIAQPFRLSCFGAGKAWLKLRAPPCSIPIFESLSVYARKEESNIDLIFQAIQGYSFISAAKAFKRWRFVRPPLVPLSLAEALDLQRKLDF